MSERLTYFGWRGALFVRRIAILVQLEFMHLCMLLYGECSFWTAFSVINMLWVCDAFNSLGIEPMSHCTWWITVEEYSDFIKHTSPLGLELSQSPCYNTILLDYREIQSEFNVSFYRIVTFWIRNLSAYIDSFAQSVYFLSHCLIWT